MQMSGAVGWLFLITGSQIVSDQILSLGIIMVFIIVFKTPKKDMFLGCSSHGRIYNFALGEQFYLPARWRHNMVP